MPAVAAQSPRARACGLFACGLALLAAAAPRAAELPIFDAHVHYSHDAWEQVPPAVAIDLLRRAGVRRAPVSSSDDEGNRKLVAAAPGLILPSLRPYRARGELSTWTRDESVIGHVEERLRKYRYAALGEFHLYGTDTFTPARWPFIVEHARWSRAWLADLPADVAERIAWKNGEALFGAALR